MTVTVSATVTDVTGLPDSRAWRAWSPVYREGSSGEVVNIRPQPVRVVGGRFVGLFEPGVLVIENPEKERWTVTVPNEDADLWELIATAVAFPPDTSADALASAVTTFLEENPVTGVTTEGISDSGETGREVVQADTIAQARDTVDTDTYGVYAAARNGVTNDRAALAAADTAAVAAGKPLILLPGTHVVSTSLTITQTVEFRPGAVIKPANGVTVTLAGGVYGNCRKRIFDHSAGGLVVPRLTDYHPVWWGPIGTADDSQTWKDMAASVAAHGASSQFYVGANFGVRVFAPPGTNRILGVELALCEIYAARGVAGFAPPAGTTSGVVLTLGNYAQIHGGFFTTTEAGHAVTLLYLKGYRAQANEPYITNMAANSVAIQMGSTSQGSTTPVVVNPRIVGANPAAAGTIGIDMQSSDAEGLNVWIARQDIGMRGQRGSSRWTNVHVWACTTGIGGDSWDEAQFNNVYLDSNLGWGMDLDKADRVLFNGIQAWNNGAGVASTGGIRLRRTTGSARQCQLRGVFLNDNTGTGLLIDGPEDYELDVTVSSSIGQGGGSLVTAVGVQIESGSLRTVLDLKVRSGDGATTPLVDNSTTTIYTNTHLAPSKTTPVDADEIPLHDSAVGYRRNRLTWANLKAALLSFTGTMSNKTLDESNLLYVRDDRFRLRDAADLTKQVFFNVASGQSTGTMRNLTLPAVDATLATLAGTETLTTKTIALGSNTVSGTKEQFNTACTDGEFAFTTDIVPAAIRNVATSNLVKNADTTVANFLSVPVAASKKYVIRGALVVAGNQAADFKFRLQNTGGAPVTGWFSTPTPLAGSATSASAASVSAVNNSDIAASAGVALGAGLITGTRNVSQIIGYLETGAGASQTLDVQVAQTVSDASDTTFYAGSWLEVQEVV